MRIVCPNRIVLQLLFCLISCAAHAAQSPTSPATSSITPTAQTAESDLSKEPYVFELLERNIRLEADGKGQRDLAFRVRIQSESAVQEFGLLVYPYASSFETLDVVYVRVLRPDGTIIETPPSD